MTGAPPFTNSPIVARYVDRTPGSAALHARAERVLPAGVTHDSRLMQPHQLAVTHAKGARKWDVDGNEYVDYVGGHGALMLGHAHPDVMAAVAEQLARGTHYGANHELEVIWAELVVEMVPSAEMVRFTSSGTEATLMALRLARAATGRPLILRFKGHFHGWHDHMAFGFQDHFDGTASTGVLPELASNVVLVDPDEPDELLAALETHGHRLAAAILEPTGASYGQVPMPASTVTLLREETAKRGIVLIFDEVVTGFRVARGGAQEALGIRPDLTTLAKILAGGLPGGAVAGRRDLLELLDPKAARGRGVEKVNHQGTYNANPVSAAAGIATLELLRDGSAIAKAHDYAATLRRRLNEVVKAAGVNWLVYGQHTGWHVFVNPEGLDLTAAAAAPETLGYRRIKAAKGHPAIEQLRLAMRRHGVDIAPWPGGPASAAHDESDLERTVQAFASSLEDLKAERVVDAHA
ncbi:MAG: aminotransferase class III-fold pyridoxal phosphate-dependent enzyme [Geminicoccaceae bacterium]|nr:MAG: aminotransferase class III-fold pyridoxal phosphate-dependent enzyme [Geminicoccaceae bacterium]